MSKPERTIRLVLPDTGPLISLARANALGLLLVFRENVRIVITDFVEFEVTRNRDRFPDGKVIADFLTKHSSRIEIQQTQIGQHAKADALALERFESDPNYREALIALDRVPRPLADNIGEQSISSFAKSLINDPPGPPVLILAEDEYFIRNTGGDPTHAPGNPTNAHLLSTHAFINTLGKLGKIADTDAIWNLMKARRADINSHMFDLQAEKIATNWADAIDDEKAGQFEWTPPKA